MISLKFSILLSCSIIKDTSYLIYFKLIKIMFNVIFAIKYLETKIIIFKSIINY